MEPGPAGREGRASSEPSTLGERVGGLTLLLQLGPFFIDCLDGIEDGGKGFWDGWRGFFRPGNTCAHGQQEHDGSELSGCASSHEEARRF